MPPGLQNMRRLRAGRHRVFYTGHHSECSYLVFFIKEFTKTGFSDEDDRQFQRLLASALEDQTKKRIIRESDEEETRKMDA